MSVDRMERINELIRREIGEAFARTVSDTRFDRSAVTVTQVTTARNLRTARILVSVRGDEQQQQQTMSLIRRYRTDIQQSINRDLSLKFTPVLHFELDPSIQKGDHVLDLLAHLEPLPSSGEDTEEGDND
jgi:ribosome-binding factor A